MTSLSKQRTPNLPAMKHNPPQLCYRLRCLDRVAGWRKSGGVTPAMVSCQANRSIGTLRTIDGITEIQSRWGQFSDTSEGTFDGVLDFLCAVGLNERTSDCTGKEIFFRRYDCRFPTHPKLPWKQRRTQWLRCQRDESPAVLKTCV